MDQILGTQLQGKDGLVITSAAMEKELAELQAVAAAAPPEIRLWVVLREVHKILDLIVHRKMKVG